MKIFYNTSANLDRFDVHEDDIHMYINKYNLEMCVGHNGKSNDILKKKNILLKEVERIEELNIIIQIFLEDRDFSLKHNVYRFCPLEYFYKEGFRFTMEDRDGNKKIYNINSEKDINIMKKDFLNLQEKNEKEKEKRIKKNLNLHVIDKFLNNY